VGPSNGEAKVKELAVLRQLSSRMNRNGPDLRWTTAYSCGARGSKAIASPVGLRAIHEIASQQRCCWCNRGLVPPARNLRRHT
jgi:hypothetical protein